MQAYISSKSNQTLLHNYAYKTLMSEWPQQRTALSKAIDACLETSSDIGPFYANWSVTKENIATINVEIWKKLKSLVTKAMNGAVVEHSFIERPIDDSRGQNVPEVSEVLAQERSSVHEDLYRKQW